MEAPNTTEVIQETNTTVAAEETPKTLQENLEETRKIAEFRHRQLIALTCVHIQHFCQKLMTTNGVSYEEKLQTEDALIEAMKFALDFGLGITKANIREKGKLAKEVNNLAGIFVQTLDNRMLLIADNMKKHEDNEQNNQATEVAEETQEQTNG